MQRQSLLSPEPAYVLHQRPYRETSLLLEVFSCHHGRKGLVARGARRAKSPWRHVLQAFQPLLIRWSGRGDLGTLTHAELSEVCGLLPGARLRSGLYVNELMLRLTHRHDPQPELYHAYAAAIQGLHAQGLVEHTLRLFEKRLLQVSGYGLVLDHEVKSGAALEPDFRYIYEPESGPLPVAASDSQGVSVSGRTLLALAREEVLDAAGQQEAKRLMRYILKHHLGGRPLASRDLFRVSTGTTEG